MPIRIGDLQKLIRNTAPEVRFRGPAKLGLSLCAFGLLFGIEIDAQVGRPALARSVEASWSTAMATRAASPLSETRLTASPVPRTDLELIDAMMANHSMAIAVANDGLIYAQDSQVRRIALRVAESQTGEMQLLRGWRVLWYPGAPPATLPAVGTLPSAGTPTIDYDRRFLETMIGQLEAAVALARSAGLTAEHAELRQYASSMVETRTSEVEIMQTLL